MIMKKKIKLGNMTLNEMSRLLKKVLSKGTVVGTSTNAGT